MEKIKNEKSKNFTIEVNQSSEPIQKHDLNTLFTPIGHKTVSRKLKTDDVIKGKLESSENILLHKHEDAISEQVSNPLELIPACETSETILQQAENSLRKAASDIIETAKSFENDNTANPLNLEKNEIPDMVNALTSYFDSPLSSPMETHTTVFTNPPARPLESAWFENMFDTILSCSCLMIAVNIVLNLWLLASIVFPDLKKKKSNFLEKYKICKKISFSFAKECSTQNTFW